MLVDIFICHTHKEMPMAAIKNANTFGWTRFHLSKRITAKGKVEGKGKTRKALQLFKTHVM